MSRNEREERLDEIRAQRPPMVVDKAALLYPDSAYLQAEWRRAVALVRQSQRGWLLDKPLKSRHA